MLEVGHQKKMRPIESQLEPLQFVGIFQSRDSGVTFRRKLVVQVVPSFTAGVTLVKTKFKSLNATLV